ncbi:REP element-mobilizing transposase RayT [Allopseudospirillum japonicum]|uniref:REP element-mobilizing transposase RayT n=1 Tax=Allopseudospirillum japonicum TaxID=64971 RepID=A0A1H6RGL7_9GAMM|nr:transposase [Allopseudospirillum japonicum]SEI50725.1 REP element-mobilizing transposase RayT [Allopseudospirillum japonicum]
MPWNDLRRGRYTQQGGEYFITFTTFRRQQLFCSYDLAKIVYQHIQINEKVCRCRWFTWVLMPDHFHGLLRIEGDTDLSSVVAKLKGKSAYLINQYRGQNGKVWQPAFYDRALRTEDSRRDIARYIVANPIRKMLVQSVRQYPFWNSDFL